MVIQHKLAFGIGILMGAIFTASILVPVFVVLEHISIELADVLLTSCLVLVTSAYTLATYGQWWSKRFSSEENYPPTKL